MPPSCIAQGSLDNLDDMVVIQPWLSYTRKAEKPGVVLTVRLDASLYGPAVPLKEGLGDFQGAAGLQSTSEACKNLVLTPTEASTVAAIGR